MVLTTFGACATGSVGMVAILFNTVYESDVSFSEIHQKVENFQVFLSLVGFAGKNIYFFVDKLTLWGYTMNDRREEGHYTYSIVVKFISSQHKKANTKRLYYPF